MRRGLLLAVCLSAALAILGLSICPAAAHGQTGLTSIQAVGLAAGGFARVANVGALDLHQAPSADSPALVSIPKGDIVQVLSAAAAPWYAVAYRGAKGYVDGADLIATSLAGTAIARRYARVIVVSLSRQQAEAYQHGKLIFIAAVTTGQPGLNTPLGVNRVTAKLSPHIFHSPWPMSSPYYYSPETANYAMRYRRGGYYLHDAPWRPYYGVGTQVAHVDPDGVARTGSHGCVNLPAWAAAQLYRWVRIGTVVDVVR